MTKKTHQSLPATAVGWLLACCLMFVLPTEQFGQTLPNGGCGTVFDDATIARMNAAEPAIQQRIAARKAAGGEPDFVAIIPVKFYIVRQSNGTGGLQPSTVSTILSNLNSKFSGTGFYFSSCSSTEYIDDSALYNFDDSEQPLLLLAGYTPGALNLYFTNDLTSGGGSLNGYSYLPNTNTPDIAVVRNSAATTSTMPHEVGHYFGLYHTHGKFNCGPAVTDELVNGCNCKTYGDNVCDTPADPNLQGINCSGYLVNGCTYSNTTLKDANQQVFAPMVSNLMSYAPETCRTQFTTGQKDRMAAQYQLYRSYLGCVTPCAAPISVYTTEATHNTLKVTWSSVSNALRYEVQFKTGTGAWSPVSVVPSSGTFVQVGNLPSATVCQARVRAICPNGASAWKESSVTATLSLCAAPTNLFASDIGSTYFKLNWAPVSGASSYTIQLRPVGSIFWTNTVASTSTSVMFFDQGWGHISQSTGVASNTTYEYRVRANCTTGFNSYSDWSPPKSFTTLPSACNSPAPAQLVLVNISATSMTVKCTTPGTFYQFRKGIVGGGDQGYQVDPSSSNIRTFTGLQPCTPYEVQCRIRCQAGVPYSTASASQIFTTPGCASCNVPAGLTTSATTHTTANISWGSVPGALNYAIQWREGTEGWSDLPGTFSGTSATVQNLQPGSANSWRIRANCSTGQPTAWSNSVSANTAAAPCGTPLGLKTMDVGQNSVTFLWSANSGAATYTLQYQPTGGTPQEVQVSGTSTVIYALTPGLAYTWKLKVNCASNQSGAWQTGAPFTTLPANSLAASPSTQSVTYNAGTATIAVTANIAWDAVVTAGNSWLTVCPSSGQSNGNITATFTANTGTSARTATVNITGGGITRTVTITQAFNPNPNCSNDSEPANNTLANAPTITLNTDKFSQIGISGDEDTWKFILPSAQNVTVTLTTLPADYELKVYNSTGGQIGSSTSSGLSNESITLNNLAAGTYYAKAYGFNGANSPTQCYTLKVATLAANTLTISPTTKNVGSSAGSETFSVSSNVSWTATDNAIWLTLSPISGSNNGSLTASFASNTGASARTATITLTGGGITQTSTLVQAGAGASCAAPTGLQATDISQNTATVSWGSVPGAVEYQLQFLSNGDWITIGQMFATSTGLYGLMPNSTYSWRVIAFCTNQQSAPSATATFATPTVVNCTGGSQWPATALTPTANWQYQAQMQGGEYCLMNVQAGTTYTFSYCSSDGASLAFDGEISIRNTSDQLIAYSDDACGNAPKVVWQAGFSGQVRVLLTKYECLTQSTNSTLAYKIGNGLTGENEDRSATLPLPSILQRPTEHSRMKVSVFPNPTSGAFNLAIENIPAAGIDHIQVLDQLGRVVWSDHSANLLVGPTYRVDASAWATGLYVVRVVAKGGGYADKKMVVNHR